MKYKMSSLSKCSVSAKHVCRLHPIYIQYKQRAAVSASESLQSSAALLTSLWASNRRGIVGNESSGQTCTSSTGCTRTEETERQKQGGQRKANENGSLTAEPQSLCQPAAWLSHTKKTRVMDYLSAVKKANSTLTAADSQAANTLSPVFTFRRWRHVCNSLVNVPQSCERRKAVQKLQHLTKYGPSCSWVMELNNETLWCHSENDLWPLGYKLSSEELGKKNQFSHFSQFNINSENPWTDLKKLRCHQGVRTSCCPGRWQKWSGRM